VAFRFPTAFYARRQLNPGIKGFGLSFFFTHLAIFARFACRI
jgi:hypothetical protein